MSEEERLRAIIASMVNSEDKSGMEAAFAELQSLPFGPERESALRQLITDYEGRESGLRDDLTMAYDQFTTPAPEALQGPSGNPYAYTTAASPLEHAAAGYKQYQGGKEMKRVRNEREALSQSKELAVQRLQAAALRKEEEKIPWWMR